MSNLNPDLRNFLTGALGYLGGAAAGFLFIFLAGRLGLVSLLFGLIDENQTFVRILAIPVFAGLMLALGGAVLGGLGGWALGSILGISRKGRQVVGSGAAFAVTVGGLTLLFILLIGFIGIYNNFTTNRIEQYGLIFGLLGLIFGLLTGILQALMSVRLRDSWRVILAATLGFTLGGLVAGLLVRLVNPTAGFQTYPILTSIVLILALAAPFVLGGGALGYTYGRLAKRMAEKEEPVESLQPSIWQTVIVALIGIVIVFWFFGLLDQIAEFLTIRTANTQTQIASVTTGVHWSEVLPYTSDVGPYEPAPDRSFAAKVTGPDQVEHEAWCSQEGTVNYQQGGGAVEQIDFPGCSSTPTMGLGADGQPHLVWYATEILDTNGVARSDSLLVESIRTSGGWSDAALVARTGSVATPSLAGDDLGNLLLVWQEEDQSMYYTVQEVYICDEEQLSEQERAGMQAILDGGTRLEGEDIPFCRNEFRRILYTPNPEPEYSNESATPNGAFDKISGSVSNLAQYEVLFSTMQYEELSSPPSPGNVLAKGVAELYQKVKANPEFYPRGMTVRILLGNYPVVSNLQWGAQIEDAITDFREAGVVKMVDPEIGWRLEVANFPGVYPHSHTKFLVIDGKLASSAGYNYGYLHLPVDHPSGKGYDLLDLGMSVIGPVAQDAIAAYDDMWDGADMIHCEDFHPADGSDWKDTCQEVKGTADHVPEVLRYFLTEEGGDNSFSLYRNSALNEGDDFIKAGIGSSVKSIEIMQANFSLELICMLNIVFPDVCTIDDALPWMDAMLDAIKENQTQVRVIMENTNSNGLENRVAGTVLLEELERLGLDHLVELRFYDGKIHSKAVLIDDALLIIGSQNLHYSAWGEGGGLNEHSITTNDPEAITEYKGLFEAKWEQSIPFEEAEFGSSP